MHFIDQARITVRGGRGGDGITAFRREKYVPAGGPSGGDGGKGGDVVLRADNNLQTLLDFQYKRLFAAGDGTRGGPNRCTGASSPTCARRAAQDAQKSPRIASTDPSASSATAVQDGVTQTIALIGP